jgi:hypothetical protein
MNQQLVCDSAERTCATTATERASGLCEPCVSDAQCMLGQLCVKQNFGSVPIGYFCLWQRGAGVGGAPALCSSASPFAVAGGAVSIDGTGADICKLAATTCLGYAHFRNLSIACEPTPDAPDDSACGADGVDDAHCRAYEDTGSDTVYACTLPCLSDVDCPTTCNTVVMPHVCRF